LTNEEQVRAQVQAEDQKLKDGLAVFFLGKFCPLIKDECKGPSCQFFLVSGEQDGNRRILTGGNCSIALLASQAGPIADGMARLAMIAATPDAPTKAIIPAR